jgi:hypothetical protein
MSEQLKTQAGKQAGQSPPLTNSGKPNLYDIMFLILLAGVLGVVVWVGMLSHAEGYKNEVTKHNGEAWVKWLKENSTLRTEENYVLEACAANNEERKRWGDCFTELTANVPTLKDLKNPFNNEPIQFVAKCDPKDRSTVGEISIEKLVPTPPGSAVPVVASQLVDIDPIDTKINLKLTVCDKGGYPIKIDEFEF